MNKYDKIMEGIEFCIVGGSIWTFSVAILAVMSVILQTTLAYIGIQL